MQSFRETAFYLLVWKSILVALVTVVALATQHPVLAAAFLVGADVALVFSLALIVWAQMLTVERVTRTGAWRDLPPGERPAGEAGRRWARNCLQELALRFAKAASAAAAVLSGSALLVS
jgi:hypothetical protein